MYAPRTQSENPKTGPELAVLCPPLPECVHIELVTDLGHCVA